MPYVTCPTCGERGKIPSSLIGVRIKCRKCGLSFLVSAPSTKTAIDEALGTANLSAATAGLSAAVEVQGIEVEGLDASTWTVPGESATAVAATQADVEIPASESAASFVPASSTAVPGREYKLLTSRDKYFDGKFDLARLEEALNHYARLGWVARSMSVPHVKGFTGALEEVIVVLLERCNEAS
jgi:hypothetical protein